MLYSIALSAAVVAASVSAIGGIIYLLWNLSVPAMITTIVLSLAVSFLAVKLFIKKQPLRTVLAPAFTPIAHETDAAGGGAWALGLVPTLALAAVCFVLLSRNQ